MGVGKSSSKPLAPLFGAEEEGKRGPTLGSLLLPGTEASTWRLTLAGPLRIQVFDTRTAKAVPLEDATAVTAIQDHTPFTTFCASEDADPGSSGSGGEVRTDPRLIVGCQDGTVLVFALSKGTVSGPLYELRAAGDQEPGDVSHGEGAGASGEGGPLAASITVLHLAGDELYVGSCSRCCCWDLARDGELKREFHVPGSAHHPATPSALAVIRPPRGARDGEEGAGEEEEAGSDAAAPCHLWVGLDNGTIAVFDVRSGVLTRSFACMGPETVTALAHFRDERVVFALSAHKRVSVWEAGVYTCLQKYRADLMTCSGDLSAMVAVNYRALEMSLLVLAGVDGSLCVRRVSRRTDGKLNCVLLFYMESVNGDGGCPITSIGYHAPTDNMLVGDAGCTVALVGKLKEQLGHAAALPGGAAAGTASGGIARSTSSGSVATAVTANGSPSTAQVVSPAPQLGLAAANAATAAAVPTAAPSSADADADADANADADDAAEAADADDAEADTDAADASFPVFRGNE